MGRGSNALYYVQCEKGSLVLDREPLPTAPPTPPAHRGGANEAGAREQGAARPGEGTRGKAEGRHLRSCG